MNLLTPGQYALKMQWPVEDWAGNCYAVCWRMLELRLVRGELRYGDYLGPVAPRSMFQERSQIGFVRHGWIELPDETVLDPTRWVFEVVRPYIHHGDGCNAEGLSEYDAGAQSRQIAQLRPRPSPSEVGTADSRLFGLAEKFVLNILGIDKPRWHLGIGQLFWIANLPLPMLGDHARRVYDALQSLGKIGLVPIDNLHLVCGGPRPAEHREVIRSGGRSFGKTAAMNNERVAWEKGRSTDEK